MDGYFPRQPVVNQEGHVEYHYYLGILNETRICLQRLYYSDMSNLPVAYQLATVYRAIADLKLAEARDISQRKNSVGGKANATGVVNGRPQLLENRLLHEATDSLRKMDEVLRRVERDEGKGTLQAKLQLLNRQIDKSNYLSPAELQTLFEQSKADYLLLSRDKDVSQTTRSNAKDLLRRLGLRITFSASGKTLVQDRLKLANELRDLDEGTPPESISSLRLASESASLFDEAKCIYYASQLAQKYWERRPSGSTSPSIIDAMFYSLTVHGNIEEAKGFLASHLKKLPKHDEYKLREASTETCIRRTICSLLWEPSTARKVPVNHSELLNLAIMLSPESEELLHLFEGIASNESDENVLIRLRDSLDQSGAVSMRELIELVKCASSGSHDRMEKVLHALAKGGSI